MRKMTLIPLAIGLAVALQSYPATDGGPEAAAGRNEVGFPRLVRIRKLLQRQRHHHQRRRGESPHPGVLSRHTDEGMRY